MSWSLKLISAIKNDSLCTSRYCYTLLCETVLYWDTIKPKFHYELIGAFAFSVPKTRSMQMICVIGYLYWNPRIEIMPLLSLLAATTNTDAASDSKVGVMVTLIVGTWVCYGCVSTGCYYVKLILIYTHHVYGLAWINMIWHEIILVRHFSEPTCGFVHRDRCQITIDPC